MSNFSYRALWAQQLVRSKVDDDLLRMRLAKESIPPRPWIDQCLQDTSVPKGTPKRPTSPNRHCEAGYLESCEPLKLCIVGSGIAGLYIALLLDSLEDPNISYDILEASGRSGGRVRTHHFSAAPHDYCDTGAMRFPKIPLMQRVFDLFQLTSVPLVPYHMDGPNCPTLFNEILKVGEEAEQVDAFKLGVRNGGLVPDEYAAKGASCVLEEAFRPFKEALMKGFDSNFELLLQQDRFSTREYLRDRRKYNYHTIQWLETMCSATGLFDQSFTESILDSLDFDYPQKPVRWYCIDGGGSILVDRILKLVKVKPQTGRFATSIGIDRSDIYGTNMVVKLRGENDSRRYSTVFNTTSLACMQRMDLSKAELHPAQKEAIRSLHYDASAKIAIKFKYPWWTTKCGITRAGTASTDGPLRLCVYPSYSIGDDTSEPAVLLCSYTWAQDALRIGALITDDSPDGEEELRDLMIRDLARMHAHSIQEEEIAEAYITHYAFDWTKDQYASGAFALFGPGQFSNLYPYLTRPTADAKLHIVGEATSAHHAWLVGSLDSAYRAVYHFLQRFELHEGIRKLERLWGTPGEMEVGDTGTAHIQTMLGRLRPEDHVHLSARDEAEDYVMVPYKLALMDGA